MRPISLALISLFCLMPVLVPAQMDSNYHDNGQTCFRCPVCGSVTGPHSSEDLLYLPLISCPLGHWNYYWNFFEASCPGEGTASEDADYWIDQGNAFYQDKEYEEAIRCYQKAIGIDLKSSDAWNKGLAHEALGDYSEAILCFDAVLAIDPLDSDAKMAKARAEQALRSQGENQSKRVKPAVEGTKPIEEKIPVGAIIVAPSGGDYTSIQEAVDAAEEGEKILVYNGHYRENVEIAKRLTLKGIGSPVVDASQNEFAILLKSNNTVAEGL